MIQIGDPLPDATLTETTQFGEVCPIGPSNVSVAEAAKGKRVVLFGVPGAFTPTCSERHLPGYLAHLDEFKAKKVDEIWCVACNDGFTMAAWGRELHAIGKLRMLGDGNCELAKKLGLERDMTKAGLGTRMTRCSLLIENGIVKQVNVEAPGKFEVSNAETMLKQLG